MAEHFMICCNFLLQYGVWQGTGGGINVQYKMVAMELT